MLKFFLGLMLITSIFFVSCVTQTEFLNPTLVKVYFFDNSPSNEVYCFDAKQLVNNEILAFGVHSNTESQFETDGHLYLQKINANGEKVWNGDYLTIPGGGFPSNVIKTGDNTFVLFWTTDDPSTDKGSFRKVTIDVSKESAPSVDVETITAPTQFTATSSIIYAAKEDNGSYLLMGTAKDSYSTNNNSNVSKKIYISEYIPKNSRPNIAIDSMRNLSQQEYEPSSFGSLGSSDLPYIKRLGKYFHIWQNKGTWYSISPFKKGMALKEIGSLVPIYTDSTKWIETFCADPTLSNFPIILSHPDDVSEIFFQKNLNLQNLNLKFKDISSSSQTLTGWDTSSPLMVTYLTNIGKTLLVGTSKEGHVKLQTYDAAGNTKTREELGQSSPYKPAQVLLLDNGNTLAIVGTTEIGYTYKRIFLIKLPLSEL